MDNNPIAFSVPQMPGQTGKNFFSKLKGRPKLLAFIIIALLVLSLPIILFLTGENQDLRQRASQSDLYQDEGVEVPGYTPVLEGAYLQNESRFSIIPKADAQTTPLTITAFTLSPSSVPAKTPMTASITIKNNTSSTSPAFATVYICRTSSTCSSVGASSFVALGQIAAGQSKTVTATVFSPDTAGSKTASAIVAGGISALSANKTTTYTVTSSAPATNPPPEDDPEEPETPAPSNVDLQLRYVELNTSRTPITVAAGSTVNVRVRVANDGAAASSANTILHFCSNLPEAQCGVNRSDIELPVGIINSRDARNYTTSFTAPATSGTYSVGAQLFDGDLRSGTIKLSYTVTSPTPTGPTSNPTGTTPAFVIGIENASLQVDPEAAAKGAPVTASIKIVNRTPVAYSNFTLLGCIFTQEYRCNPNEKDAELNLTFAANEEKIVNLPLTAPTTAGQHYVSVRVFSGNVIKSNASIEPLLVLGDGVSISPSGSPEVSPETSVSPSVSVQPSISEPSVGPTTVVPSISTIPSITTIPGNTYVDLSLKMPGIGTNSASQNINPRRSVRIGTVLLLDVNNKVVRQAKQNFFFDSAGNFSTRLNLGGEFTTGFYQVKVKLDNTLRKLAPGIINIQDGAVITIPTLTMISGDLNGNNKLDINDYNILVFNCLGSLPCSDALPVSQTPEEILADLPGWTFEDITIVATPTPTIITLKQVADLNDDGKVDEIDNNILLRGFINRNGD